VTGGYARIHPPELPRSDVRRERLLKALLEDPAPVTVVCGPAGSGKSSLLTRFATEAPAAGGSVVWLGLERWDSDPTVLWTAIIEAVDAAIPTPEGTHLDDLVAPPSHVGAEFVDMVLAALEAPPGPVWLVLDDLHAVRSQEALASIELLARRLPTGTHLVLASRSDPAIDLHRLRLEGRLRELRADDLAFTAEETRALLQQRSPQLPAGSAAAILERTEGWAAGIAIASMALDGVADVPAFLERFDGDDHTVADYLASEVLSTVPDDLRAFMERTSICSQLHVGLAQQLTGRQDATAVLEDLVRDGVFTQRLGRARDDYRYHELLRTYLMADLRRSHPRETERELHRIAGEWWANHGEPLHAIEHLHRAGDLEKLAAIADQQVLGLILDGKAQAVAQSFATFDADTRSVPSLAVLGAIAAVQLTDPDEADQWLDRIDPGSVIQHRGSTLGDLMASAYLARARLADRRDLDLAALENQLATPHAGNSGDHDVDLYVLYNRGVARGYLGRYDAAIDDLDHAARLARVSRHTGVLVECLSFLAGAQTLASDLATMPRQAEQALELARQNGWTRSAGIVNAYVDLAWSRLPPSRPLARGREPRTGADGRRRAHRRGHRDRHERHRTVPGGRGQRRRLRGVA
jgi:LuxR family transcriptional regulator, maltose regulon positive regulatory protein